VRISWQTQDGFNVNIGESCELELAILVSLAAVLQFLWDPAYWAEINRWAGAYNVLLGIQKAHVWHVEGSWTKTRLILLNDWWLPYANDQLSMTDN
jgi:hypothetical protein